MKKLILVLMGLMFSLNVAIAVESSDVDCSAITQSGSDASVSTASVEGSSEDTER